MMEAINGRTLIDWGYSPGPWFGQAITEANAMIADGQPIDKVRRRVEGIAPAPVQHVGLRVPGELAHRMNIRPDGPDEVANVEAVERHMVELMRVPTVKAGAVMPDACPAGSAPGTIPVGGVIAAENAIHPGMHSADICCSMAMTNLGRIDPKAVLDAGMAVTHFGGGGRPRGNQIPVPADVLAAFDGNRFLSDLISDAREHFASQGDGNHFFYVGRLGEDTVIVTHHGSRKPGAMLYKKGMAAAQRHTRAVAPEVGAHNAWLPGDSTEGEAYWKALQAVRLWTKASHYALHDLVAERVAAVPLDRFWNEHNFVFRRADGLYYHGKGATPAWSDYADDATGLTLIPLNMAEPVLIVRGKDAENGLGFAPHGAGRNHSRTAYMRQFAGRSREEVFAEQTVGIDARSFCGIPDISELPGAYKNAAAVRAQIEEYGLAEIVAEVQPYGCIMAGDWQVNAPWRKKRAPKPHA